MKHVNHYLGLITVEEYRVHSCEHSVRSERLIDVNSKKYTLSHILSDGIKDLAIKLKYYAKSGSQIQYDYTNIHWKLKFPEM
jgi:hypothetical protein